MTCQGDCLKVLRIRERDIPIKERIKQIGLECKSCEQNSDSHVQALKGSIQKLQDEVFSPRIDWGLVYMEALRLNDIASEMVFNKAGAKK